MRNEIKQSVDLFGSRIFKEMMAELLNQETESKSMDDFRIAIETTAITRRHRLPARMFYDYKTFKGIGYWTEVSENAARKLGVR